MSFTLKTILLILLISSKAFCPEILAENPIELGTPYQSTDAAINYYFTQGDDMLTVKISKKQITTQKFNLKNLTLELTNSYPTTQKLFDYEDVIEFNDRFFIIYSSWNKKEQLEQLFYQEVDFQSASFKNKPKRILASSKKIAGALFGGPTLLEIGVIDKFSFYKSFTKNKLLINFRLKPTKKNDGNNHDVIGFYVFNEDFTLDWSKTITMPMNEKKRTT